MSTRNFGLTRRDFLKTSALMGGGVYLGGLASPYLQRAFGVALPGGSLDPTAVTKYAMPLIVPPPMPRLGRVRTSGGLADYYEIAVRQFEQQILPSDMPVTTVWSYGSPKRRGTFNYPAFTIEARQGRPVRVRWINGLVDKRGNYLPHLLPVDQTLHWANPPGGVGGRDMRSDFMTTPGSYTGPVPIVTHVHGAHTFDDSDGYPEAWFLPNARNIPAGYAEEGTWYEHFAGQAAARQGRSWSPGTSVFDYPNDQRATTLWYHDHTLGMTRNNVYAGPAGFYLIRGGADDLVSGELPGPAPGAARGRKQQVPYEIPLVIQDRSFNADGSLFYPDSRAFFDGYTGPYIPETDVAPIWNPEFFGNTMVANGRTWPTFTVEPRRYRFRLLNGCNSRFLILQLAASIPAEAEWPPAPALPFWQIGAEGGFLAQPAQLDTLLMAPAERADVVVDFTGIAPGTELFLVNLGPDEPFGGGVPGVDFPFSDPGTTGQVMRFVVGDLLTNDMSLDPSALDLPTIAALPAETTTRALSLNEIMSMVHDGPAEARLGTVVDGSGVALRWHEAITENPGVGDTEVWELYNFTADAHPIHVHLVQFEVVNRQALVTDDLTGEVVQPVELVPDTVTGPEPWEDGRKDTVIAFPGQVTRIRAKFDKAGLFVWHCHIVEHEDNEMMRPYAIGDIPTPGGDM